MKDIVGTVSVVLSGSYLLPQIIRLVRRQSADDISRLAFVMQFVSCSSFLWYSALIHDTVLVTMATINLVEIITILALTLLYRRAATQTAEVYNVPSAGRKDEFTSGQEHSI